MTVSFLKKLLAGRATAGEKLALLLEVGLVPKYLLTAEGCDRLDPVLRERDECGGIIASGYGVDRAVRVDLMRLGMVLKEMGFVTGRASDAPVVDPHLESVVFADLTDLAHYTEVAVPVIVRKHMDNNVHIVSRHFSHIVSYVAENSVAVVRGTRSDSFHFILLLLRKL
jgi:hypothetical protein